MEATYGLSNSFNSPRPRKKEEEEGKNSNNMLHSDNTE